MNKSIIEEGPHLPRQQNTVPVCSMKNSWLILPLWEIDALQKLLCQLNFPASQMIVIHPDRATQIYCQYQGIHYLSLGGPHSFAEACRTGIQETLRHAPENVLILKKNIDFLQPYLVALLTMLCHEDSHRACISVNHALKNHAEHYHVTIHSTATPTNAFTWQQKTLMMKLSLSHLSFGQALPLNFEEMVPIPSFRQFMAKKMLTLGERITQYGQALESRPFLYANYKSFIFLKNKILHHLERFRAKNAVTTAMAPTMVSDKMGPSASDIFLAGLAATDAGDYPLREKWYSASAPKISIIILNYNKADLTLRCVKELWRYTHSFFYEIIVLDNGSEAADYQQLKNFENPYCQLIRLAVNRYFPEGNNIATEQAKGDYLFFLNNDAFVTENWLPPLVMRMDENRDIGIVGPMFLYPDGKLQEAGCTVTATGTLMIGDGNDPNGALYNIEKEVDYISAAGILVRKKYFDEVLGFDFFWGIGYYEDVDLAFKMKSLCKKIVYCPLSKIIHIKNATSKTFASFAYSTIQKNHEKFMHRWENEITNGFLQGERLADGPTQGPSMQDNRLMGISLSMPLSIEGSHKYLLALIAHLSYLHKIVLFAPEKYSLHALRSCMKVFGLHCADIIIDTADHAKNYQFDIFIVVDSPSLPITTGNTNIYVHLKTGYIACPFLYDAMIVPALSEENATKAFTKSIYITGVPGIQDKDRQSPLRKSTDKIMIMSVRNFSRPALQSSATLIQTFLKLKCAGTALPIELHLLGALDDLDCLQQLKKMAAGAPVHFYLNSPIEILYELYKSAHLYWQGPDLADTTCDNAISFKFPVLEAMSFGCVPIIFKAPAVIDYVTPAMNGFICTTEQEFIDHSQRLIQSPLELRQLSSHAIERGRDFSQEKFINQALLAFKREIVAV